MRMSVSRGHTATPSSLVKEPFLWVKTLASRGQLPFCARACARQRVFAAVSSHLASQVGCGNEIVALSGLQTSRWRINQ